MSERKREEVRRKKKEEQTLVVVTWRIWDRRKLHFNRCLYQALAASEEGASLVPTGPGSSWISSSIRSIVVQEGKRYELWC
jgi:hypothetical protein